MASEEINFLQKGCVKNYDFFVLIIVFGFLGLLHANPCGAVAILSSGNASYCFSYP